MSDLKRVRDAAERMSKAATAVEEADAALKRAKEAHRRLEQELLPDIMAEVGLSSVTLSNGEVLQIKADCSCKIPKEKHAEAMRWLQQNDFGGLIKCHVTLAFGRGEIDKAEQMQTTLAGQHDDVIAVNDVHHSTLKAFVKERLEAGEPLPLDLFGVHTFDKAVLTR